MRIKDYNQMMSHLTRPGTPEQNKKAEENNKKYLAERKAKTLKSYGLTEKDLKPAAFDPQTLKPGNTFDDVGRNFLIEESKARDLSSEEIKYLKADEYSKNKNRSKVKPLKTPNNIAEYFTNQAKTLTKKAVVKKPIQPIKQMKIDPFISDPYSGMPDPRIEDPRLKELENKFKAAQEQSYQEKVKNNSKGLRSFAPIKVNRNV